MRIAIVHSYYGSDQPSGENLAVDAQRQALSEAGHDVALFSASTDELARNPLYPIRAAAGVATGHGRNPLRDVRRFAPDVVHVHNLFPNFGRAWVCRLEVPLIHTLHNYRPLCPAGTMYLAAQGSRAEDSCCVRCQNRPAVPAVIHRCYRGSALATLPVAVSTKGVGRDPVLSSAALLFTLTPAMRDVYVAAGVDERRTVVVPNFVPRRLDGGPGPGSERWLYVGRLSPEKGIAQLLDGWPVDAPLTVVGRGPLLTDVRRRARRGDIEIIDRAGREQVAALMRRSLGLVLPSRWLEGFPLVYAEALAAGLPVLAGPQNGIASLVDADGTGAVFTGDLEADLANAREVFPGLRAHCRGVFEDRYTEDAHVRRLERLYASASSAGRDVIC